MYRKCGIAQEVESCFSFWGFHIYNNSPIIQLLKLFSKQIRAECVDTTDKTGEPLTACYCHVRWSITKSFLSFANRDPRQIFEIMLTPPATSIAIHHENFKSIVIQYSWSASHHEAWNILDFFDSTSGRPVQFQSRLDNDLLASACSCPSFFLECLAQIADLKYGSHSTQ